eukprot:180256-Lingulodinium_polyedra.AAC.1
MRARRSGSGEGTPATKWGNASREKRWPIAEATSSGEALALRRRFNGTYQRPGSCCKWAVAWIARCAGQQSVGKLPGQGRISMLGPRI